MSKKRTGMGIGTMVLAAVCAFVLFALIGGVCILVFNGHVKPINTRIFRVAADWCRRFGIFYYSGCLVSLILTIVMAVLGGKGIAYSRTNCIINILTNSFIALCLAVIFYLSAPTKTIGISFAASLVIFLQGFGIFFVAQFFAPKHWNRYSLAS